MNKTIKDLILELEDIDLPQDTPVKVSINGATCDLDFIYLIRKRNGEIQLVIEQNLD